MKQTTNTKYVMMAIAAAALYGVSSPASKLLLEKLSPTIMASMLYLGAGIGMLALQIIKKISKAQSYEASLTKKELPYIIGMIILDIAAPIFLMIGLTKTTSSNASLLNNFEIVATAMIALFIFKEAVGKRMWTAIFFITLSSIVLTFEDISSFTFSVGSVFVLLACVSWGLENNCTRMLSIKDPGQIVVIKGLGSGFGALLIAWLSKDIKIDISYALIALILGFVAYGLSLLMYIRAQRELGAARTSAYYAAAPFIGVLISWIVLKEAVTPSFLTALFIMLIGTYFAVTEDHEHAHIHTFETHEHKHRHDDNHHTHTHVPKFIGEHSHEHRHEEITHSHSHTPEIHHRHQH